jgi:hypothetical protein
VVRSSKPIYQVSTAFTQLVYGPTEPLLTEHMQYVWRVQARDKSGKDAFRNHGFSQTCSFIYGGTDPALVVGAVAGFEVQTAKGGKATFSWQTDAKGFESYRLQYRKKGAGNEWFSIDTKQGEAKIFDLEKDTNYEARIHGEVKGAYGPYSQILTFRTPKQEAISCGENTRVDPLVQGRPLAFATTGMLIHARGMEVILEEVEHLSEDGFYKGRGLVAIPYLGGANFHVRFERIYIDEDRNVVSGRIEVVSKGVEKMAQDQLASQQSRQQLRSLADELTGLDTASAATLLRWSQSIGELQASVIDETLVLKSEEKEGFKVKQGAILRYAKTLADDPTHTTAISTLRQELAAAKPLIQKLGEGVGKGILVKLRLNSLLKDLAEKLADYKQNAPQIRQMSVQLKDSLEVYLSENPQLSEDFKSSMRSLFQDLQAQSQLATNDEVVDSERQQAAKLAIAQATAALWSKDILDQLLSYARQMQPSQACLEKATQRAIGDFWERLSGEKRLSPNMRDQLEQIPFYIMGKLTALPLYAALSVGGGVVEMGKCITAEEPQASYISNFSLGIANALFQQADIFSLDLQLTDPDLIKALLQMLVNQYECIKGLPATLTTMGAGEKVQKESVFKILVECKFGINYEQAKQAVDTLQAYLHEHADKAHFHGQVTGHVLTIALTTKQFPKFARYFTASRATEGLQVASAGLDAAAIRELMEAAQKGTDEVIRVIRKLRERSVAGNAGNIFRGITKSDFFNTVEEFKNGVNPVLGDQAWDLWKQEKWSELELLFKDKNINGGWPPNRGFIDVAVEPLAVGEEIDRYGGYIDKADGLFKDKGNFASPKGASFESRALPVATEDKPKKIYKVIKEIPNVKKGQAIPWFNQPGKGIQYELPESIDDLLKGKYIEQIN